MYETLSYEDLKQTRQQIDDEMQKRRDDAAAEWMAKAAAMDITGNVTGDIPKRTRRTKAQIAADATMNGRVLNRSDAHGSNGSLED